MSVDLVLAKMTAHNSSVLGCIVTHAGQVHHNLPDGYDLVDREAVSEYTTLMFQASDALETDHAAFDQMFLEFQGHGFYARRLDDGVLILLTEPMQSAQFKKAQVGVNLFLKPLKRALDATGRSSGAASAALAGAEPPRTGNPITPTKRRKWF